MSSRPNRSRKTGAAKEKIVALYHDMLVSENFERCAQSIFSILQLAQKKSPGQKRVLYLAVQGHRNAAGGYDRDAYEIISNFSLVFLLPYLTELHTPLIHVKNSKPQKNDVPPQLVITPAKDQEPLTRDALPEKRTSKPTVKTIKDYLGIDEQCFICWRSPVERAHAIPQSLGGSNDKRNIVLLCKSHHQAAPDVDDPEAFWNWVDWRISKEGRFNRHNVLPETEHFLEVKMELKELYNWTKKEIDTFINPKLLEEFYRVLDGHTTTHFGIKRKPSTEAWAFHKARLNLGL